MKRLSAVLLIIALLITMMPLTAFADSPGTINVSNSSEILSAISAVSDGGTIALTSNIILLDFIDIDYGITKNITIDLNGHTLSHRDSDTTLIIKYGTGDLTIKDTSTSKSGLIIGNNNTGSIIELWDGLTKIESGTVKNWGSQSTVALYGDSNCEISGGTIDNAGSFGALEVATAGKLNIMGGNCNHNR